MPNPAIARTYPPKIRPEQHERFSKAAGLIQQGGGYATALAAICTVPLLTISSCVAGAALFRIMFRDDPYSEIQNVFLWPPPLLWIRAILRGESFSFVFRPFLWPPLLWCSGPSLLCLALLWLGEPLRKGSSVAVKFTLALLLFSMVLLCMGAGALVLKRPDLALFGLPLASVAIAWAAFTSISILRLLPTSRFN